MMNALSCIVVCELHRGVLTSMVGAKCLQLEAGLALCPHLEPLMAVDAQSLEGIMATHVYQLRSPTSSRKYLLPLGITG
jgi:hypothetical protein